MYTLCILVTEGGADEEADALLTQADYNKALGNDTDAAHAHDPVYINFLTRISKGGSDQILRYYRNSSSYHNSSNSTDNIDKNNNDSSSEHIPLCSTQNEEENKEAVTTALTTSIVNNNNTNISQDVLVGNKDTTTSSSVVTTTATSNNIGMKGLLLLYGGIQAADAENKRRKLLEDNPCALCGAPRTFECQVTYISCVINEIII